MEEFWMVWAEGQGRQAANSYSSLEEAKSVAERLANEHLGCKVFVLEAVERVVCSPSFEWD